MIPRGTRTVITLPVTLDSLASLDITVLSTLPSLARLLLSLFLSKAVILISEPPLLLIFFNFYKKQNYMFSSKKETHPLSEIVLVFENHVAISVGRA